MKNLYSFHNYSYLQRNVGRFVFMEINDPSAVGSGENLEQALEQIKNIEGVFEYKEKLDQLIKETRAFLEEKFKEMYPKYLDSKNSKELDSRIDNVVHFLIDGLEAYKPEQLADNFQKYREKLGKYNNVNKQGENAITGGLNVLESDNIFEKGGEENGNLKIKIEKDSGNKLQGWLEDNGYEFKQEADDWKKIHIYRKGEYQSTIISGIIEIQPRLISDKKGNSIIGGVSTIDGDGDVHRFGAEGDHFIEKQTNKEGEGIGVVKRIVGEIKNSVFAITKNGELRKDFIETDSEGNSKVRFEANREYLENELDKIEKQIPSLQDDEKESGEKYKNTIQWLIDKIKEQFDLFKTDVKDKVGLTIEGPELAIRLRELEEKIKEVKEVKEENDETTGEDEKKKEIKKDDADDTNTDIDGESASLESKIVDAFKTDAGTLYKKPNKSTYEKLINKLSENLTKDHIADIDKSEVEIHGHVVKEDSKHGITKSHIKKAKIYSYLFQNHLKDGKGGKQGKQIFDLWGDTVAISDVGMNLWSAFASGSKGIATKDRGALGKSMEILYTYMCNNFF